VQRINTVKIFTIDLFLVIIDYLSEIVLEDVCSDRTETDEAY
jgi:hypothetical protein